MPGELARKFAANPSRGTRDERIATFEFHGKQRRLPKPSLLGY